MIRRFLSLSRQEREAVLYTKEAQFLELLARELEALGPATATQAVEAIASVHVPGPYFHPEMTKVSTSQFDGKPFPASPDAQLL